MKDFIAPFPMVMKKKYSTREKRTPNCMYSAEMEKGQESEKKVSKKISTSIHLILLQTILTFGKKERKKSQLEHSILTMIFMKNNFLINSRTKVALCGSTFVVEFISWRIKDWRHLYNINLAFRLSCWRNSLNHCNCTYRYTCSSYICITKTADGAFTGHTYKCMYTNKWKIYKLISIEWEYEGVRFNYHIKQKETPISTWWKTRRNRLSSRPDLDQDGTSFTQTFSEETPRAILNYVISEMIGFSSR